MCPRDPRSPLFACDPPPKKSKAQSPQLPLFQIIIQQGFGASRASSPEGPASPP